MMHPTTFPTDSKVGKYNLIDGFRLTNSRDEGPGPSKKISEFQENSSDFYENSRRNELSINGKVRRPNLEHLLLQAPPPSDYSTPFEAKGEINDSFSYVPSVSGDWNDEENEASFTIEYLEEKPRLLRPKNESSSENAEKYMELDPNESILASSGDPNDFGIPPLLTNYSPMFQELTRKLMEEERVKSRVLSFDERIKRLKEELAVVKEEKEREKREEQSTSSWSSRPSILRKGSIRRPIRRKSALSIHTVEYDTELIDMNEITCEMMENMSEDELKHVCNSLFESSPRVRFRGFYPFLVEGMIQKDYQTKDLKLFSSRLRNVRIPDTREPNQMSTDYVYFVVVRQGVFGGFWYETHPSCLISAKFRSQHETVLHGYAILAYPIGSKEDSMNEERWICWNDSLGMMSINKRSAMIAMKKQPGWDKQLDIVTFSANSYNGRYVVDKIVALTNAKDKRFRIPVEIFLIVDATFLESRRDDIVFYSDVLKSEIFIKKDRIGNVNEALPYELIVAPTFPSPTIIEFRVLLIVQNTFWTEDKMWIRSQLAEKTNAYRV